MFGTATWHMLRAAEAFSHGCSETAHGGTRRMTGIRQYARNSTNGSRIRCCQIIAAPLALVRGAQDISWTLPEVESTGNEVHVTWSLPAFTDVDRAVPQLVGAVSIDLSFVTSQAKSSYKSLHPVLSGSQNPIVLSTYYAIPGTDIG
eukprot:2942480-Rhodomonas_salina.4